MKHLPQAEGSVIDGGAIKNRILTTLPPATLDRIRPTLELVTTTRGQVLSRAGDPVDKQYFINRGTASLIKTMQDGRTVAVAAVGIEGVTNPTALFGIERALLDCVIQVAGTAFCMSRAALNDEMTRDNTLRATLRGYNRFAINLIAQNAACNQLHSLQQRCCRWLLMAHDSVQSEAFPLTHEFLAMVLGVRRAGVSLAANELKKAGLIRYTRGLVTIIDRPGLERAACECDGILRHELDEIFENAKRLRMPRLVSPVLRHYVRNRTDEEL